MIAALCIVTSQPTSPPTTYLYNDMLLISYSGLVVTVMFSEGTIFNDSTGHGIEYQSYPFTVVDYILSVSYTHLTLPTNREV